MKKSESESEKNAIEREKGRGKKEKRELHNNGMFVLRSACAPSLYTTDLYSAYITHIHTLTIHT